MKEGTSNQMSSSPAAYRGGNPGAGPSTPLIFSQTASDNPSNLSTFLRLVAEGEQDRAEAILKINADLALVPGDITDLSQRSFSGMTAFQYAVWALDWHMWTMLRKYLSDDAAHEQIQSMETGPWISQHGKSASWQNLINALQKQIDLLNQFKWSEAETKWQREVGGAQRLLPAHVINEYCHPSRPFKPCPDFSSQTPLPRTRNTDKGEWFTARYNGGQLGDEFAVLRYSFAQCEGRIAVLEYLGFDEWEAEPFPYDLEACIALLNTRTQQKDQLVAELTQVQRQQVAAK